MNPNDIRVHAAVPNTRIFERIGLVLTCSNHCPLCSIYHAYAVLDREGSGGALSGRSVRHDYIACIGARLELRNFRHRSPIALRALIDLYPGLYCGVEEEILPPEATRTTVLQCIFRECS